MTLRRCVSCKYDDCDCVSVCVDFTQEPGCPTHFYTDSSGNQKAIPVQVFGPYVHDDQGPFNPLVDAGCWSRVGGLPDCKVCCGGYFDDKCATGSLCVDGGGTTRNFDGLRNGNGRPTCRKCESLAHDCNPEYDIYNPHPNACIPGACCHPHPECGCTPDVESIWYNCGLDNVGSGIVGGTCSDCTVACCRSNGTCAMVKPADCIDDCETGGCTCTGINCSATRPCCGGLGVSGPGICRMRAPCECKNLGGVPAPGFASCNDPSDYCNPCTLACCTPFGDCRERTVEDCHALCRLVGTELICGVPQTNKCCNQTNCDLTHCCICGGGPFGGPHSPYCVGPITNAECSQRGGTAVSTCFPRDSGGDIVDYGLCSVTCCHRDQSTGLDTCVEGITALECRNRNGTIQGCNVGCGDETELGSACRNACCILQDDRFVCVETLSAARCLELGGNPQPYPTCRLPGCQGSEQECTVCDSACCCHNNSTGQNRCVVTTPGKCLGQASHPWACEALGPEWNVRGEVVRTPTCSSDSCGTGCCVCNRCVDGIDAKGCREVFGGVPLGVSCENGTCDINPPCADAISEPMIRPDALAIPINRGREKLNDVTINDDPCQQYGGDIRFSDDGFGHAYFCNRWDRLRPEVGTRLSRCVVVIDQVSGLAFFKCPYRRECPDFN